MKFEDPANKCGIYVTRGTGAWWLPVQGGVEVCICTDDTTLSVFIPAAKIQEWAKPKSRRERLTAADNKLIDELLAEREELARKLAALDFATLADKFGCSIQTIANRSAARKKQGISA